MKGVGDYGYVLFFTSAAAFRAESLAKQAKLAGARLVPTPRELSSDCGVALRFPWGDEERLRKLLTANGVPYDRLC
jgi:hypothetical protein